MVRQVSRCTQKACRKGCRGITCYRRKCCCCYLKPSWKGRWICGLAYMDPNCFCCRTYWCMVDVDGTKKFRLLSVLVLSSLLFSCLDLAFLTPSEVFSIIGSSHKNYLFYFFLECQIFTLLPKIRKALDFFFHPQQRRLFITLRQPFISSLESINSGDFDAFFGLEAFLTFFPAFVVVFFASLDLDAF